MKKIYEAINARVFSTSVIVDKKPVRLVFDEGDKFRGAQYLTESKEIQEAIENSPIWSQSVRLFFEETEADKASTAIKPVETTEETAESIPSASENSTIAQPAPKKQGRPPKQ